MITVSQLTERLGWTSLINIVYLFLATIVIAFIRGATSSIHGKMFRMNVKELDSKCFGFLSNYKIMTLVFIMSPYIALKIMSQ
jgi:preprotein translocase subunit SecY